MNLLLFFVLGLCSFFLILCFRERQSSKSMMALFRAYKIIPLEALNDSLEILKVNQETITEEQLSVIRETLLNVIHVLECAPMGYLSSSTSKEMENEFGAIFIYKRKLEILVSRDDLGFSDQQKSIKDLLDRFNYCLSGVLNDVDWKTKKFNKYVKRYSAVRI